MPYLVRHAHAGDKRTWRGPDTLRHELGVDADPAGLVELLMDPATGETVLCSHGELIGAELTRLVGQHLEGNDVGRRRSTPAFGGLRRLIRQVGLAYQP